LLYIAKLLSSLAEQSGKLLSSLGKLLSSLAIFEQLLSSLEQTAEQFGANCLAVGQNRSERKTAQLLSSWYHLERASQNCSTKLGKVKQFRKNPYRNCPTAKQLSNTICNCSTKLGNVKQFHQNPTCKFQLLSSLDDLLPTWPPPK